MQEEDAWEIFQQKKKPFAGQEIKSETIQFVFFLQFVYINLNNNLLIHLNLNSV